MTTYRIKPNKSIVKEFPAGGNYGIELSSINSLDAFKNILKISEKYNFSPDRIDECRGFSRLPIFETKEILKICIDKQIGFYTGIGIRSMYDIGGYARSRNGYRASYKIRGNKNVEYAYDEIKRAVDFGIRGFIIYDEGFLNYINNKRKIREIPSDIVLKASVHMSCSNKWTAELLYKNGANTINLVPDLSIEMLDEIRKQISVPMDVYTDTASDAGGFLRTNEVPEIITICSPVYLKCGSIAQENQNHLPNVDEIHERLRQTKCVIDIIEKKCPDKTRVSKKELTLGIPKA